MARDRLQSRSLNVSPSAIAPHLQSTQAAHSDFLSALQTTLCAAGCDDYVKIWATAAQERCNTDGQRETCRLKEKTASDELLTLPGHMLLLRPLARLPVGPNLVAGSALFRHSRYWLHITLCLGGQG